MPGRVNTLARRAFSRGPISGALALACCGIVACPERGEEGPAADRPVAASPPASTPLPTAPESKPPEKEPRLTRPAQPLNVLLLTVDALRADMPWAGYERDVAPNLTALARESVVWENHRSVASYTAQTVGTLLSGRYASTLYRNGWFFTGYAKDNEFFPEVLSARGIKTLGLHAHAYFGKDKGLDQGFDVWETVPGITFDSQTDRHVTSPKSARRLMELLDREWATKEQFFFWAHFMDPHDLYVQHEESPRWGRFNRDRYDSEVFFTDSWLGKVLDFVRKKPFWNRTAVIVTGDHGEAFGEHGMYKHAFDLWDVLVRVPLIIRAPGAAPARISQARTHLDLAPTIVDLMGLPPLEGFQGHSLVPELYGAPPASRPVLLELAEDSHNPHVRALLAGDYKLIVYGPGWTQRLFNLKDDPGEKHDLAKREPEKLKEMRALFDEKFGELPSVRPYGHMKLRSGRRALGPEGPERSDSEENGQGG